MHSAEAKISDFGLSALVKPMLPVRSKNLGPRGRSQPLGSGLGTIDESQLREEDPGPIYEGEMLGMSDTSL